MKHEWRKIEKDIYMPKNEPEFIFIPSFKYFCIKGKGNPNGKDFANRIGALYALSYTIRMMHKSGKIPEGYFEYTVYPLEGIWDLSEKGRKSQILIKDELIYTLMIRQPDFVDKSVVDRAFEIVRNKNVVNPLIEDVTFEELKDGDSVQMLHVGSYDTEVETFDKMKEYISKNDLEIRTLVHREIYLSDFRKTSPNKLKTVLRYKVNKLQ